MIEQDPFQLVRAKLYAEVYAAWAKMWAENPSLAGYGGPSKHATQALEDFDAAIGSQRATWRPDSAGEPR